MRTETYLLSDCKIHIPIPDSYKDCLTLIKSDRYRITGKVESSLSIIVRGLIHFDSWLFGLRLLQHKGWLYPLCKIMYAKSSKKVLVKIPPSVKIGYGLYVGHNMCMIINGGTVIGNNVNISQFLNIGTNHKTPAIIGDNVYIAPSVCLVEDVKIGNNSSIGAGAVVTKDVPENATVAGCPAKVLNYNNPSRYIDRCWSIQ